MSLRRIRFSLSSMIAGIVLGAILLMMTAFLAIMISESKKTSLVSAQTLFKEISAKTVLNIGLFMESVSTLTDAGSLAFSGRPGATRETFRSDTRSMKVLLDTNDQLMSVYIGYTDGGFHQLIAVRGQRLILEKYAAPEGAAFIDRTIQAGPPGMRMQHWEFLDANLHAISARTEPDAGYDPRQRPWYSQATEANRCVFTAPYIFSSSRLPGITCAQPLPTGGGVLGMDLTLAQLGTMLSRQQVGDHGLIWIIDQNDRLVAFPGMASADADIETLELPLASQAEQSLIRAVSARLTQMKTPAEGSFFLEAEGEAHLVSLTATPPRYGLSLVVALATPLRDITGHIDSMALRIILACAACLFLLLPAVYIASRRASRSVEALARQTERISRFDFSASPRLRTSIREIQQLATACESMKETIRIRTEHLENTQKKLELLVREGVALSAEKDINALVSLIFQTAQQLTEADGGVLYLLEKGELGVEMLSLGDKSVVLGGLSDHPAPRVMVQPAIMEFLSRNSVLRSACEAFNGGTMLTVRADGLELFPTGLPEEPTGFPIHSLIAAPIITRRNEVLGVIQLFNPACLAEMDDCGEVAGFIGSLTAQAAVTLDNRNLVRSLRDIFDALIQVIATSIDAKSHYTAGHCRRVPAIAEMLAEAAHEVGQGPLADFRLDSENERRQLWIASWLHDCGKVTTPEYVVDKATKLETIYNRIHEVRMRFEVLRRDAEIAHLMRLAAGQGDSEASLRGLDQTIRVLEEEFAFVAECNIGGEFLSDERIERLQEIGKRTWQRHFSDLLGISGDEMRARGDAPEPRLPVTEALLSDRPEHLLPRHKQYTHIKDASGQPVETPAYEHNRGELYNLAIRRGTLTSEERFIINEHTLSGMEMLQKIPFPDHLGRVVEIATEHHETLIGTGYPLHKRADRLSTESRILAIADIFEALTASDRPYKQPKKLSEALRIMSFMRDDQHIDADLFDLFLRKGVYRAYAEAHLSPEQIDEVQIEKYLRKEN
ncbi:MAG: HD domain-containing phosphohydrolase [Desulfovibrio sp.]